MVYIGAIYFNIGGDLKLTNNLILRLQAVMFEPDSSLL